MPLLGYGTFMCPKEEIQKGVETALKTGYRHFDCAWVYFNEAEIGEVFEKTFSDPDSGIKREDVFVTSKLSGSHKRKDQVRPAFLETLNNLKLKYLDLYLVHAPFCWDPEAKKLIFLPMEETWREMEKLVDEGLVKNIGVSNFNVQSLMDLLSYARIKPVNNQIERHPYLVQKGLVDFCQKNGITLTAYAPLGAPGAEGRQKVENEPALLKDPIVVQLAEKYKVTPAQILLRWSIEHKVSVIPKSLNPSRIVENWETLDFSLVSTDVELLDGLEKQFPSPWRYFDQSWTGAKVFE